MLLQLLAASSAAHATALVSEIEGLLGDPQFDLFERPASKPFINSDDLQDRISGDALEDWASRLWSAANESTELIGHPTRAIGTPGHNATLELIFDTLDELSDYYDFEAQPFVALGSRIHNWSLAADRDVLGNRGGQSGEIPSKPLSMCPPAKPFSAPIDIIPNEGCLPSDFANSSDKIAVVKRGNCAFGDKAEIAGLSGAKAILIWDPESKNSSEVFKGGDLGTPLGHQVPALGISVDTAIELQTGKPEEHVLSLYVDSEIIEIETVNVIAETKGGDHDNVVFAGAHSDSVLAGPGINDNGSGLITLLEVAKQLTHFEVKNAVRFGWWSAEELGLKGSLHYTDNLTKRDAAKIRLFLDYDMLASRNYVYEIYDSDDRENPVGSSALRDMYKTWFTKHGYNYSLQPFDGRSDYVGFVEIGIPSSGIDAGVEELKTAEDVSKFGGTEGLAYDPCYHLACDNLDNISIEPWVTNAKLVAHSVAGYATSLKGFPDRSSEFYEQRNPKPRKWSYNNLA